MPIATKCMRTVVLAQVVAGLAPAFANAAVLKDLSPEQVAAAIEFGSAEKEWPCYEIRKPGFFGSTFKPRLGCYSTPFLRIAQAAYQAKKEYKAFAPADVTSDMLAPELHVIGSAQADGPRVANLTNIVITPKGKKDPASATRPVSTEALPVQFRNLMGMEADGKGLKAVFPLESLKEGFEIHMLYDSGVHDGGKNKYCDDCAVEFKLDTVR